MTTAIVVAGAPPGAAASFDVCATGCAFTGIQAAVDAAVPGAVIHIGPGVYAENVTLVKRVALVGAGSGSDPAVDTIITPVAPNRAAVDVLVAGVGADDHVVLTNFAATGAFGSAGGLASGVRLRAPAGMQHVTLHDVRVADNAGHGIIVASGGPSFDIAFTFVRAVGNGGDGVRVDPGSGTVSDVRFTDSTSTGNARAGFHILGGTGRVTDVLVADARFAGNAARAPPGAAAAEIAFTDFNGRATVMNVDVESAGASYGVAIRGGFAALPATLAVRDSVFAGTVKEAAVAIEHYPQSVRATVTNNRIDPAEGAGLTVTDLATTSVDASANWWGAVTGPVLDPAGATPRIASLGAGIVSLPHNVAFSPWCRTPACAL